MILLNHMKNTYIAIVVLIVLIGGGWFLVGMNKQAEAPTSEIPPTNKPISDENIDTNEPEKEAVKEFTVSGSNFSFTPSNITVNKGDKVKITFKNTQGFHDFKIDEYGVATKQANSPATEVLEFTADKTGSFQYYCSVGSHIAMGMWGTLVVN